MENAKEEHRVTRRDFLARSGKVAGAAPAVALLLSTTAIPNKAIAAYLSDHGGRNDIGKINDVT
jgi:hypothetical protein